MTTQTKKFVASFTSRTRFGAKRSARPTFYTLAKKHIVKGKAGGARDLSERIDEIAYGV